ncbi:Ppx/GppA phosphatase family protein [Paenibacillus sp. YYML68]|uniref:Ppx/GppA phosphatase family protein n=1 Tax=Paenibacillus sp. YYML68 TaxID=2909250 RepID=UPI002490CAB4|nr:Ppx/GppA phosphatase family protein [Paenibacillus sp. YYML68]
MSSNRRIGIIDIGSNSIRLAIYELLGRGYRVVSEFKESARLSGRVGADGVLGSTEIQATVRILLHFKRICSAHQVTEYRVVATAAIRNAANAQEIVDTLQRDSGLPVEILSGEDEARIGFIGMIHTMDLTEGLLIDIGGGSTEVSLFRERKLVRSVSFPFGAVNTTRRFAVEGEVQEEQLRQIREMVEQALEQEPWIREAKGLPLVGLGGGVRTLCKISQRRKKYSLQQTHNYVLQAAEMNELALWLPFLPSEKRKKVDGLSKDRHDIIIPGLVILQTVFETAGASHYVISGAGLRDGLFYETFGPEEPAGALSVAEHSSDNLLALHSTAPEAHLTQVVSTTLQLYDALADGLVHQYSDRTRLCLKIAAKLYRVGVSLQYYQYPKHSFHMIAHTRIDGFSHRETMLCALIASFKTKARTQQAMAPYRDIVEESDADLISKLGILVQLAAALDVSETQALQVTGAFAEDTCLHVRLKTQHDPSAEYREVEGLLKDFKKLWGLQLKLHEPSFSTS